MEDGHTDLADRVEALERENQSLEARLDAYEKKLEAIKSLIVGGRTSEGGGLPDDVPDSWSQLRDVRETLSDHDTALKSLARQTEAFDSSGGASGAGASKVAKIRRALVKRATRRGKAMPEQATQAKATTLDYEGVQAIFDFEITRTYASDLIDDAASDPEDDAKPFWVDKSGPRKRLKIDLTELPEHSPYLAEDVDIDGLLDKTSSETTSGESRRLATTRNSEEGR